MRIYKLNNFNNKNIFYKNIKNIFNKKLDFTGRFIRSSACIENSIFVFMPSNNGFSPSLYCRFDDGSFVVFLENHIFELYKILKEKKDTELNLNNDNKSFCIKYSTDIQHFTFAIFINVENWNKNPYRLKDHEKYYSHIYSRDGANKLKDFLNKFISP